MNKQKDRRDWPPVVANFPLFFILLFQTNVWTLDYISVLNLSNGLKVIYKIVPVRVFFTL